MRAHGKVIDVSTRLRNGLIAAVVAVLLLGGALAATQLSPERTADTVARASTTTVADTTTTVVAPTATVAWPQVAASEPRAVTTPTGVVLAVLSARADGTFLARSPCGNEVIVPGSPLTGATVVLDPGHGGEEPGAVGPAGTREKDVNLAIALETKRQLEGAGATVVLTRTGDYRITLASRTAIAKALDPEVFVSIHHNAEPDEVRATPGSETYFQIGSADSKRAAGLVYEELVAAFSSYPIEWGADFDAGAKYRPSAKGGDYYGILSGSAGVPAVLSEAAFISNPPEEALLNDPVFQAVEAAAITRAVVRYVTTDDPGSGFVEPYPRTAPAGGGGGARGCVDPQLV